MYCARLDHFVRLNADGTIGKCGHMVGAPGFSSWDEMQNSSWLTNVRSIMNLDRWPDECIRCHDTENVNGSSIRLSANQRDQELKPMRSDYLVLGGVLDNICNSACQSCNSKLSTKIGSLEGNDYPRVDNVALLDKIPLDKVIEIDINGGEPTASPNYQQVIQASLDKVKIIRINTNGSRIMPGIQDMLDRGIRVIVTLSLDGTGRVHDYVRWPITWSRYVETVMGYKDLRYKYSNLELQAWTTLHALNAGDWRNIVDFSKEHDLGHSWAWLHQPRALDARYRNSYTLQARQGLASWPELSQTGSGLDNQSFIDDFIQNQDSLRRIDIKDFL